MTERGRLLAVVSPILLIAVCRAVQQVVGSVLGVWAWVPTMLLFWAFIAGVIVWVGSVESVSRWLQPARGPWVWRLLAITAGLLSLAGFVKHCDVVRPPAMLLLWLTFALVNPWFEEGYWRGLLLDATAPWGGLLSVSYSAIWFAVSHPLIWGVHSVALRHWATLPVLAAIGAAWAVSYRRSGSLRWPVVGHMCADLFGLSVPVLLKHSCAEWNMSASGREIHVADRMPAWIRSVFAGIVLGCAAPAGRSRSCASMNEEPSNKRCS